jgi:hypothetical protein
MSDLIKEIEAFAEIEALTNSHSKIFYRTRDYIQTLTASLAAKSKECEELRDEIQGMYEDAAGEDI